MSRAIKPNLLVIGAMKASTTLLYEMLGRHPQVWFPSEKEPHYFTSRDYGTAKAYEDYLALFAPCPPMKQFVGEASTGYTKTPYLGPTPKRIGATLGVPKLIYILRDPVQRTISNFKHAFARGYYPRDYCISRAVVEDPIIVGASLYSRQLAAYEEEFGGGSVLVVIAEDLHRRPLAVMREIEAFLGAESFDGWSAPVRTVNSSVDVRRAAVLERYVGRHAALRRLSRHTPSWLKSALRCAPLRSPSPPPVTAEDERCIFNLLAEDLVALRERLGGSIDCWPSVRMLRSASPRGDLLKRA